jgi:hypothetical protein
MNNKIKAGLEVMTKFNKQIEERQTTGLRFMITMTTDGEEFTLDLMGYQLFDSSEGEIRFTPSEDELDFDFNHVVDTLAGQVEWEIDELKKTVGDIKFSPRL